MLTVQLYCYRNLKLIAKVSQLFISGIPLVVNALKWLYSALHQGGTGLQTVEVLYFTCEADM